MYRNIDFNLRKNRQQKRATLLQNKLKSDVSRFTTHDQT